MSIHSANYYHQVFGNNGKFLPQRLVPLRHPKKNDSVTFCQLRSRLHQEPLLPPESIINIGGLADLQLLSSFRHLLVSVPQASAHRPAQTTLSRPTGVW